MTDQDRTELSQRLRWLAAEWRRAPNALRRKIEDAFDRGLDHQPEPTRTQWQTLLESR